MDSQELLTRLSKAAKSPQEQGELFERFAVAYLHRDPYYRDQFSNIWRWNDWPGRGRETDFGIDIVAEERETGRLWAIQVKFHAASLSLPDIATFLALSGRKEFSRRMLFTASALGPKAEQALAGQEKAVVVLTLADIAGSPIGWDSFDWKKPESFSVERKKLHDYQEKAITAVAKGFEKADRGKLIMPPGSGKTFVSLRIAEKLVGPGGYVLFLAPSIALVEQTIRAWLADADVPLRTFAVTSDYTVGQDDDSLEKTTILTIPATTEATELVTAAGKPVHSKMTVVVSTYHSIDVITEAQGLGLSDFDLIIADEAHRTTGVAKGKADSYYQKVHDNGAVRGARRLYMTATPRVFVPRLKDKLEKLGYDYYSMDKESVYGSEFFRYGFGEAVDGGYLSDYRVVVLTVDEGEVQRKLFDFFNRKDTPEVEEATKIVGVWSALSGHVKNQDMPPVKRAVVFAGRIADSKAFAEQFVKTAEAYHEADGVGTELRQFRVHHVDGTTSATERKARLDWLRATPGADETRILSNARVLTEGIDVPSLDAVVFLRPRKSVVDIVQAVGRVMRTDKMSGKRYGYVVLPVIVSPDRDAAQQLENNEQFRAVWEVLAALRSIDDRFDARVRDLSIQHSSANGKGGSTDERDDSFITIGAPPEQLLINFGDELREAIMGKLVEHVGQRNYLESWAEDVATATEHLERHISEALRQDSDYGERARQSFSGFVDALRDIINPSISEEDARSMLVQHIVTKPIFDALFGEYEFLKNNPIARSLDSVAELFETFVRKETQALDNLYRQVEVRARGLDREGERQDFLRQLYDTFFKIAFPKTADRLGIVYTPVELVDFLVKSADSVLKQEFGLRLTDDSVVILEPFIGTGTFLTRLMRLIDPDTLSRKYVHGEIWGNEILLLPYYIALANVESTFYELTQKHEPFRDLLLVDSFQLMEGGTSSQVPLFPEQYTELMRKQKEANINVIVSNPPWFAKQEDENLGIKAVKYERLDESIRKSYAAGSSAANKNLLYDAYIRAIRMATDRIGDRGVIAFVTNSGFLDANNADGLRKSLVEEFSTIYVLNLRGNARYSGEAWKKEGGKIFGQGSRAGVALLILVKNNNKHGDADIYYHDIGDYLKREEKLARLAAFGDIASVKWERIVPNAAHDWINKRSGDFAKHTPLGDRQNGGKSVYFDLYSRGLQTGRDTWAYSFSKNALEANMRRMIDNYNGAVSGLQTSGGSHQEYVSRSSPGVGWSAELIKGLERGEQREYQESAVVSSIYRPFVRQWAYVSRQFNERVYQLPHVFPEQGLSNIAIVVKGPGGTKDFSTLMVDGVPDLNVIDGGAQAFPLYSYKPVELFDAATDVMVGPSGQRYTRQSNVSDWVLGQFQKSCGKDITKDDVFYYVYGLLHSPEYRDRYKDDLKKMLPRIPVVSSAKRFWAFSHAGRELANIHLNYESISPLSLDEDISGIVPSNEALYEITKMRFGKLPDGKADRRAIVYNGHLTLRGIPLESYEHVINGKSAIEWIVERYQVSKDPASGIVNDPNLWLGEQGNPRYIVDLLKRAARVGVETVKIVKGLPSLI